MRVSAAVLTLAALVGAAVGADVYQKAPLEMTPHDMDKRNEAHANVAAKIREKVSCDGVFSVSCAVGPLALSVSLAHTLFEVYASFVRPCMGA